jgi:RimJ/RimL family protein N-acetyltransferase
LNSLDEDNRRFVPDEVFETMEQTKEVVDFLISCYEGEEGPFVYAIIRKNDLKNVGYVQLVKCGDFYEIGYNIAKKYTGQGLASHAVKLFLKCLKERTNLKELYGICLKENFASARVLEKTGFKKIFEGLGIYQGEEREIIKTIIDIQTI